MIGDRATDWPWNYCGDPVPAFVAGRQRVYENRS
jgi:hypothetical protein